MAAAGVACGLGAWITLVLSFAVARVLLVAGRFEFLLDVKKPKP